MARGAQRPLPGRRPPPAPRRASAGETLPRPGTGAFPGHVCGAAPGGRERRGQRRPPRGPARRGARLPAPRLAADGPAAPALLPFKGVGAGAGPGRTPAPPPLPAGGGARGRALGKVCLCGWLRRAARPVGAGGRLRVLAGQREASGRLRSALPPVPGRGERVRRRSPSQRQRYPRSPASMGHRGERASCLPLLLLLLGEPAGCATGGSGECAGEAGPGGAVLGWAGPGHLARR